MRLRIEIRILMVINSLHLNQHLSLLLTFRLLPDSLIYSLKTNHSMILLNSFRWISLTTLLTRRYDLHPLSNRSNTQIPVMRILQRNASLLKQSQQTYARSILYKESIQKRCWIMLLMRLQLKILPLCSILSVV